MILSAKRHGINVSRETYGYGRKSIQDHASPFDDLIGEQLSSVEFVQDYFQLRFDGPTINVYNPTTVVAGKNRAVSWQDQFRNSICGQIAKKVSRTEIKKEECLILESEDNSRIEVSLREEDYEGPEAIYFHGFRDDGWGVI